MTQIIIDQLDRSQKGSYQKIKAFARSLDDVDFENPTMVDMVKIFDIAEQSMTTDDGTPLEDALAEASFDDMIKIIEGVLGDSVPSGSDAS